ncbi:MAG: ribonuclease P protein component [Armatimonadetes bacterium]|nr:ribonuclease P protein component [Armatimonadota bacterium]
MRLNGPSKRRFDEIFRLGRRVSGTGLRVYSAPGSGLMGFTTSKSLGCRARRNHLQRKVREAVGLTSDLPSGYDWIVLLRAEGQKLSFKDLAQEWAQLSSKITQQWEGA